MCLQYVLMSSDMSVIMAFVQLCVNPSVTKSVFFIKINTKHCVFSVLWNTNILQYPTLAFTFFNERTKKAA